LGGFPETGFSAGMAVLSEVGQEAPVRPQPPLCTFYILLDPDS
jgi:hypothetical protein